MCLHICFNTEYRRAALKPRARRLCDVTNSACVYIIVRVYTDALCDNVCVDVCSNMCVYVFDSPNVGVRPLSREPDAFVV